jgi:hypothetical protein
MTQCWHSGSCLPTFRRNEIFFFEGGSFEFPGNVATHVLYYRILS